MPRKWDLEKVRRFAIENGDCKLLSTEYINTKAKLEFMCKCGERFETTFENYRLKNKRHCDKCGIRRTALAHTYTYSFVKEFVENNDCKLLSSEYKGIKENIDIECRCGNKFTTTFDYFKSDNKRTCNICSEIQRKKIFKL